MKKQSMSKLEKKSGSISKRKISKRSISQNDLLKKRDEISSTVSKSDDGKSDDAKSDDAKSRDSKSIDTGKSTVKKYYKLYLMLLFIFILGIIITLTFFNYYKILDYEEIDMSVTVKNGSSSFNISTEALNFAKVYPGGTVVKRIDLVSKSDSLVKLKSEGDISKFIILSDNNFLITSSESKQIDVTLKVPESALEGDYSGKLKIYFYRP